MNRITLLFKQKILAIVFIALGLAGSLITFFYIENIKKSELQDDYYYEVIVALEDIEKNDVLTSEVLSRQKITKNIFSEKYLIKINEIEGKKAAGKIEKGEIISSNDIQELQNLNEKTLRFSSYIPYGKKAVTLPVVFYGDIKLINTGDKVDLVSTFYDKQKDDLVAETIIFSKEIILFTAAQSPDETYEDQNDFNLINMPQTGMDFNGSNKILVTFYLDQAETEKIFLSLEKGRINISICSLKNY